jgi:hypothetical protein
MPASDTRSSNSLSMNALVSTLMGRHVGFLTNCRLHVVQANLDFPLWICPLLMICLEPQRGQVGMVTSFPASFGELQQD